MKAIKYIDEAKSKLALQTDHELAERIGASTASISRYRAGKREMDTFACSQLALIIGIDPMTIIASVKAEAEKCPERREFWLELEKIIEKRKCKPKEPIMLRIKKRLSIE